MGSYVMKIIIILSTYLRLVQSQEALKGRRGDTILIDVWSPTTVTPSPFTTNSLTTLVLVEPFALTTYTTTSTSARYITPKPYITSISVIISSKLTAASPTSGSSSVVRPLSEATSASASSSRPESSITTALHSSSGSISSSITAPRISSGTTPASTPPTSTISITIAPTNAPSSNTAKSLPIVTITVVIVIVGVVIIALGLCFWCNQRYRQKHGVTYIQKKKGKSPVDKNLYLRTINSTSNEAMESFKAVTEVKKAPWRPPRGDIDSMGSTYGLTAKRPGTPSRPISSHTVAADTFYNINLELPHSPLYGTIPDRTGFGRHDRRTIAASKASEGHLSPAPLKIVKAEQNMNSAWADDTRHSVASDYRNTLPGTDSFDAKVSDTPTRDESKHCESEVDPAYKERVRADTMAILEGRDPFAERSLREHDEHRKVMEGMNFI